MHTIQPVLDAAMQDLFSKMQYPSHCLYPLLPPERSMSTTSRSTGAGVIILNYQVVFLTYINVSL